MHDCLIFCAIGTNWSLTGRRGPVNVEVRARLFSNDSHTLHEAALRDLGIAMAAHHVAAPSLAAGRFRLVLADYAVPARWIRALIPEGRIGSRRLRRHGAG